MLGHLTRMGHRPRSNAPPAPPAASVWRRALACFRPYAGRSILAGLLILLGSGLGLVPPLLVKGLIDDGIAAGRAADSPGPLAPYVLGLVLAPLLAGLATLGQQYLAVVVGQNVLTDLRQRLFAQLQRQSLRFYVTTPPGEVVARVFDDVASVRYFVSDTLIELLTTLVTVVGTLIVLFAVSWPLAVAACVTVPFFLVPARQVGRWRKRLAVQTQQLQAELLATLQDVLNVGGWVLMRLFDRGRYERDRFVSQNRELVRLRIRQAMAGRWLMLTIAVLGAAGPAAVYWYGGWMVVREQASVGTVVAFVAYLGNLYRPVTRLASGYADTLAALGVFGRIFEFLDQKPEVEDRPDAVALKSVAGRVAFEDVTFAYRPDQKPAVSGLSFTAEPGQLVALVGPSGAGKTTVTSLLLRFFDPQSGRVLIDGRDVREATQQSLADQIGMVTQDTYLFHATVRDNLLYARPEATPAELEAACRAAHIHEVIATLPDGYDTVVGERGVKLSGGERQRLAIARTLLKDPRILILDEATSALDSASERLIQEALAPLLRDRTTLAIAHRLSTILAADQILVLDGGRLVERGTHAELLRAGGLYARLYHEQFERQAVSANGAGGRFG